MKARKLKKSCNYIIGSLVNLLCLLVKNGLGLSSAYEQPCIIDENHNKAKAIMTGASPVEYLSTD